MEVPYLMTIDVPTIPPDNNVPYSALVFFDTGSQESFVRKSLATEIGTDASKPGPLAIYPFGGSTPTVEPASRAWTLGLRREDGGEFHLRAQDVTTIGVELQVFHQNGKTHNTRYAGCPDWHQGLLEDIRVSGRSAEQGRLHHRSHHIWINQMWQKGGRRVEPNGPFTPTKANQGLLVLGIDRNQGRSDHRRRRRSRQTI
jgi:hypothetical protein